MRTAIDPLTDEFDTAFKDGNATKIQTMLERHGVNIRLYCDTVPLHRAVSRCRQTAILNEMTAMGADIDAVDKWGSNVLHFAATGENLIAMQWLLDSGFSANTVSADNYTALHLCAYGFPEGVALLLKHGCDPNGVSIDCECAPLHNAAVSRVECIHLLMAHGADINRLDHWGDPPIAHALGWAVDCNRVLKFDQAKALLEYEHLMRIDDPMMHEAMDKVKAMTTAPDTKGGPYQLIVIGKS